MKKTQKKLKKTKAQLQAQREVYDKCLQEDLDYLKHIGEHLFEMKFTDFEWNVLHLAVWNEKLALIQYIISETKGKTLINAKDLNEETPLHLASFTKNQKAFDILVRNGANTDERNLCGEKPIELINLEEKCPFIDYLKENKLLENITIKKKENPNELVMSTSTNGRKTKDLGDGTEVPNEITSSDRKNIDLLFGSNLKENNFVFMMSKHQKYMVDLELE